MSADQIDDKVTFNSPHFSQLLHCFCCDLKLYRAHLAHSLMYASIYINAILCLWLYSSIALWLCRLSNDTPSAMEIVILGGSAL